MQIIQLYCQTVSSQHLPRAPWGQLWDMFQGAIWVPLRSRPLPPLFAAWTLGHGLRGDRGEPWGSDGNVQPMLRGRWGFICCPACWWTRASRFEKGGLHGECVVSGEGIGMNMYGWTTFETFWNVINPGKAKNWCWIGTFYSPGAWEVPFPEGIQHRHHWRPEPPFSGLRAHKPWDVITHHLHKGPWLCWKVFPQLRLLPSASNETANLL